MRIFVKNTFLALEGSAGSTCDGAGRLAAPRRAKSCVSLDCRELPACAPSDVEICVEKQLQKLDELLRKPKPGLKKGNSFCESTTEAVDSTDESSTDTSDVCDLSLLPSPITKSIRKNESESSAAEFSEPMDSGMEVRKSAKAQEKQTKFAHALVPRKVDLVKEYSQDANITTVMARNIPSNYAQRDLMEDLAELGLSGTFDFLYIPLDKNTMTNVGYAFINFLQPCHAAQCMSVLQGFRFKRNRRDRGRLAAASPAHIQGLDANLRHYEKAVVMTAKQKQRRPLVMINGRASSSDAESVVRTESTRSRGSSSTHGPISLERALFNGKRV